MILTEFIKNAFLYPPILKEWVNRLLYIYQYMITWLIFWIIVYIIIRYIILRISKVKSEITKKIDENWKNINYRFLKSFWLILLSKCSFIKYIITWLLMVLLSWLFVSFVFMADAWYTNIWDHTNMINEYSTYISNNPWAANDLVPVQFLQENNTYLNYMLWLCSVYSLIFLIWWWFFMTFSFGNRFVRNISIAFVILSILIIVLWKLLDFYVIK